MKKRSFLTVIFAVILIFIQASALADVIVEPEDNFYKNHAEDCVYVNAEFIINGKEGFTRIYVTPKNNRVLLNESNNNRIYIDFVYTDKNDKEWGRVDLNLLYRNYTFEEKTGWVDMSDMVRVYDSMMFAQEHQSEFKPYNGEMNEYIKNKGKVAFYYYPGSECNYASEVDENLIISQTYTDSEGRLWGNFIYYYGRKNEWVCISDPANENLPIVEHKAEIIPAQIEAAKKDFKEQNSKPSATWLVIMAVLAVVVLTALIVLIFWKKKPSNKVR